MTESWTDLRPSSLGPIGHVATGVADRADFTCERMEALLAALDAAATSAD